MTINFNGNELPADKNNVMLDIDETLKRLPLSIDQNSKGWKIVDPMGKTRMEVHNQPPAIKHWSDLIPAPPEALNATIYPDGLTSVPLESYDMFKPSQHGFFPLAYIEREDDLTGQRLPSMLLQMKKLLEQGNVLRL